MLIIGVITIVSSISSILCLYEEYKKNKMSKKTFILLLFAFIVNIVGMAYLTIANL